MTLKELKIGKTAIIHSVGGAGYFSGFVWSTDSGVIQSEILFTQMEG